MSDWRQPLRRRLWGMARHHPGGKEMVRDAIAAMHQADGTCQELRGTDAYSSTTTLTPAQWERLLDQVADGSTWPSRRRSKDGQVTWLVGQRERRYIQWLRQALGWDQPTLDAFVLRQTKKKKIATHADASAVIEPLERLLRDDRGWTCHETKGQKWWSPPNERGVSDGS